MEHEDLTKDEAAFADEYFHKNVYPVLTPMAFDSSRPFPLIRNKTLNIAALLKKKNEKDAELEFAMYRFHLLYRVLWNCRRKRTMTGNPRE